MSVSSGQRTENASQKEVKELEPANRQISIDKKAFFTTYKPSKKKMDNPLTKAKKWDFQSI